MKYLFIFLFFSSLLVSQNTIKIDGLFDDWNTDMSTYIDDSFDSEGIELLEFSICHDNEFLIDNVWSCLKGGSMLRDV